MRAPRVVGFVVSFLFVTLAIAATASRVFAEDAKPAVVALAEGKLKLTAPAGWEKVKPTSGIVEHEFNVAPSEGDELPARVTVMGAGGSIDANIDRWIGQFTQPDGGNTKERAKIEKKEIAGQEVHRVDLSGTYDDSRGPFSGKGVKRPGYRMLAAIIKTKDRGNYFVKLYGPAKTIGDQAKAFDTMIGSLKVE